MVITRVVVQFGLITFLTGFQSFPGNFSKKLGSGIGETGIPSGFLGGPHLKAVYRFGNLGFPN